MPQPNKVLRFDPVDIPRNPENHYRKPNSDGATCDKWRATILEYTARIDQTRLHIWDDRMVDAERERRRIARRPAHIIAACDTLSLICANIRQVDAYLLHNPYKSLVDDGIRLLASKAMQVLAVTDWFGVPPELVDMMKASATKIMNTAGERREWYRIEAERQAGR